MAPPARRTRVAGVAPALVDHLHVNRAQRLPHALDDFVSGLSRIYSHGRNFENPDLVFPFDAARSEPICGDPTAFSVCYAITSAPLRQNLGFSS